MLVAVYGKAHALFFPARSNPQGWPEIRRLRLEYLTGKSGISARAEGAANWKEGHQARTELVTAGLAVAIRGGVEVQGLKLTRLGRAVAWSHVADIVPGCGLSSIMANRLKAIEADRVRGDERWVSESKVFGFNCSGDATKWIDFTDSMLEPAIDGAIDSLADVSGRIYYKHLNPFEPLPEAPAAEYVPELSQVYVDAFKNEMSRLRAMSSEDGEIVVPLPC
jgi:hypothetical protein